MRKIILSYTTLNDLHEASHTWINKQMGIVKLESPAMTKGKECHKILQDHILKKVRDERLEKFNLWDFTTAEYHAKLPSSDPDYLFHGYLDAVNFASKVGLEAKFSKNGPWSMLDFQRSMQPKYYSWITKLRKFYFVTGDFKLENVKTYYLEFSDKDWTEAEAWANEGLDIIKKGTFKGGLDADNHCLGCAYGSVCHYYQEA